jgi:hypothetical protein
MKPIFFKAASINSGPVTIGPRAVPLVKPDGKPLQGGDLVPGRVYEVDIETGKTVWPPRNRKARRKGEIE